VYQAIVFLPLLGAILAGFIALAGARARFPGKGPVAGADHGPQRRDDWRGSLLDQVPVFDAIAEFADGVLADR